MKKAQKNLKSLVQIRIKALNVKKGRPTKAGRFYLRIFFAEHVRGVAIRAYFPIADDLAIELTTVEHLSHVRHIGDVPPTDVSVECAITKHF